MNIWCESALFVLQLAHPRNPAPPLPVGSLSTPGMWASRSLAPAWASELLGTATQTQSKPSICTDCRGHSTDALLVPVNAARLKLAVAPWRAPNPGRVSAERTGPGGGQKAQRVGRDKKRQTNRQGEEDWEVTSGYQAQYLKETRKKVLWQRT